MIKKTNHILLIIIFAQFAGTSLWFAANAILPQLVISYGFKTSDIGVITSSVQLGFIIGTLIFAIFTIADKFSPSKVFFTCAALGAVFNLLTLYIPLSLYTLSILRFLVGFLLAGIYPVGMKISADWFDKGLGKALGFLVGALVIGTSFPHFLNGLNLGLDWENVLLAISALSLFGGLLILLFVPDGPHRKPSQGFKPEAITVLFTERDLRSAAFGYFGHMWELYTFWAFVPYLVNRYLETHTMALDPSILSFIIIGAGFFGSAIGGLMAERTGSSRVAFFQLAGSLVCILIVPSLDLLPIWLFLIYMILWGAFVVGDSPQFSTLAARTSPSQLVGSALTMMNSIGFALTIPSIFLLNFLISEFASLNALLILAIGPVFGLIHTLKLVRKGL